MDDFRRIVEMRYRLLPYIYAQARLACESGHPMLRPLFFEYPEDPTSWLIEDEYLFGTALLVAPLLEGSPDRRVYLPPGAWTNYQSGEVLEGPAWSRLSAGEVPAIILVRDGSAIPHARLAQSTDLMDWGEIELVVYAARTSTAEALFCAPGEGPLHRLRLTRVGSAFELQEDPLGGTVGWRIRAGT